jgi:hypothetical protein
MFVGFSPQLDFNCLEDRSHALIVLKYPSPAVPCIVLCAQCVHVGSPVCSSHEMPRETLYRIYTRQVKHAQDSPACWRPQCAMESPQLPKSVGSSLYSWWERRRGETSPMREVGHTSDLPAWKSTFDTKPSHLYLTSQNFLSNSHLA